MSEMRDYPQGTPCWLELSVPERPAALDFYGAVFGWGFSATEPRYYSYSTIFSQGKAVAGLVVRREAVPFGWTTYLASDDVAATVDAIVANGGRVLENASEVTGEGRMALAADPTGAVFGAWEGEPDSRGSQVVNEPSAPVWNELVTPDAGTARPFYAAVFGVEIAPPMAAGFDYTPIRVKGRDVGGIWQQDDVWPYWSVYFGTADTDLTASAVSRAGGRVLREPADSPYGRTATFTDRQGNQFSVISIRR